MRDGQIHLCRHVSFIILTRAKSKRDNSETFLLADITTYMTKNLLGHAAVPHVAVALLWPLQAPVQDVWLAQVRVRALLPPPQLLEQLDQ